MKACGIVVEYNPFHNGHAYQIEQVREKWQPDVVIAVMSGNFLQRGEPAVLDKWTRTKMAMASGVDLVVELPTVFSTQPADFFARGAIQILGDLGIESLCFGVESGLGEEFLEAAETIIKNEELIDEKMALVTNTDVPYAKQMEDVLASVFADFPLHLNSPNNHLGFAYAKEVVRQNFSNQITLLPILRKDAQYSDQHLNEETSIASATAIRKALFAGESVASFIPDASYVFLDEEISACVSWENYFPYLKYQITAQTTDQLREIYQMTEGLEYRLKEYITDASSFEEFIGKVKTKRYTRTRLQRLFTYILLNIKKSEIEQAMKKSPAIRLLGFNERGQKYLNHQKHHLSLELISNVSQANKEDVRLDVKAGEIYRLGNPLIKIQDFKRKPIKYD